jgi:heptosyltransferase-2
VSGAHAPRRILVRAPTWLGDAVMATPALRALRAAHPQAEIAVEGRPALAGLLGALPGVDAFLPDPGDLARRVRALRAGGFDWAVLLPDSVRAALGPWLARIPRRVGHARDPLRRLLLTEALTSPRVGSRRLQIATLERYLRVTRRLGCPDRGDRLELVVDPRARERLAEQLAAQGLGADAELLLVAPGAGFGPSKRWPPAHFARASDALVRRLGLQPVLVTAPGEAALAGAVAACARERVTLLGAPLELAALAALVARARLLLCNDTGVRHVAAALGTPAVVVMGPTHPVHSSRPLRRERVLRDDLACSPCQRRVCPIDHRCLARLAPERAVAAAEALLGTAGSPQSSSSCASMRATSASLTPMAAT